MDKVKLQWHELHIQSREQVCIYSGIIITRAQDSWDELDEWLRDIMVDSMAKHNIELIP